MTSNRLHILVYLREDAEPYRQAFAGLDDRLSFCATPGEVEARIADTDVIFGSITFPVALLEQAERLRWIQVTGAGVDRFLRGACIADGVLVTRASDVGFGEQIAEYVLAHLLAQAQRVHEARELQASRMWRPLAVSYLAGRTLGVAGTGSIGRIVGERAHGLGMRVVGWARTTTSLPGFDRVFRPKEWEEFLRDLDVLVLALPLTAATEGLVDGAALRAMRSEAVLVNVARGAIVDESALVEALRDGEIAEAILDVFCREPLPPASPLWGMPNVTITSHHAGLNRPDRMAAFFLENLKRFREGRPLRGKVDLGRGY